MEQKEVINKLFIECGYPKMKIIEKNTINLDQLNDILHSRVHGATRLTTGLCHFVYLIETSNERFILRIASSSSRQYLLGSNHWIPLLKSLLLPVPDIVFDGTSKTPPFQILSYIHGKDLGDVYCDLSTSAKKKIAVEMINIQKLVNSLPIGKSYGYKFAYTDPGYEDWESVVVSGLKRSLERFKKNEVFDKKYVEHLLEKLPKYRDYFKGITPVAYSAEFCHPFRRKAAT